MEFVFYGAEHCFEYIRKKRKTTTIGANTNRNCDFFYEETYEL